MTALVEAYAERLAAAGIPLARFTIGLRTLHPLLRANSYVWDRESGRAEHIGRAHGIETTPSYLESPFKLVYEERRTVRRRLAGPEAVLDFPVLVELRDKGLTDYLAMPPHDLGATPMAVSFATDRPGGFTDTEIASLGSTLPALGLLLELNAQKDIAGTLARTYLGREAGRRVLDGTIRRGTGETIEAVIWFCDLRDSTALSERLPRDRMLAVLNAFFERMAEPLERHGGEVLKFVGDGFLAIFRLDSADPDDCACRAVAAAREAQNSMGAFNRDRAAAGEPPLGFGIALHKGPVLFGNIGTPERLDFTVIGPAVNLASRLEQLTKSLGEPILMSEDFAAICPLPKRALGMQALRGVAEPQAVYAPEDF